MLNGVINNKITNSTLNKILFMINVLNVVYIFWGAYSSFCATCTGIFATSSTTGFTRTYAASFASSTTCFSTTFFTCPVASISACILTILITTIRAMKVASISAATLTAILTVTAAIACAVTSCIVGTKWDKRH